MMRLKERFKNKPFCNDLHFFLFAVVLVLLSLKFPFFYFVLLLYLIFIFKKTKYFIPILIILFLVIAVYFIRKAFMQPLESGVYNQTFKVLEVKENNIILKGTTKIVVYNQGYDLIPGDQINATIKVKGLLKPSYTGDFNEEVYYLSKGVTNKGNLLQFEKMGHQFRIEEIRYSILNYYQKTLGTKSYQYISSIIFGVVELEKDVKEAYQTLYSSHILAISGLHILFIYQIIKKLLQKVLLIEGELLSLLVVGIYLILIGFPVAALRAYLFLILGALNKGKVKYTELDILSVSFILMVLMNPFWAFQNGFILSFLISFLLLFMNEFNVYQGILKKFYTSLLCILATLPFVINQNYEISITGLFFSFIIGFILSSYLLPILLLVFILPFSFWEYLFQGLDTILIFLNQSSIKFSFPALSILKITIYYLLLILLLISLVQKRKRILKTGVIVLYMIIICNLRLLIPFYRITFIDVGQGDSILIEVPFQKQNILIDSYNNLDYLKSIGIQKIDVLILSHLDQDHFVSTEEVVKKFNVEELYYPVYESYERLKHIPCKKIGINASTNIVLKDISFAVLSPLKDYQDANSNSLVLYTKIKNTSFLFTGDMTKESEEDFIKNYSKITVDILKVGHHGSNTSSTKAFLDSLKPSISIISVGQDNSYGHPHQEVLNRLNSISKVYMTKDCGNIEVIVFEKYFIKPYR